MTWLDRTEPSLNSAIAGDQRDTTTPGAMLSNLKLLLLDVGLSQDARSQLEAWLQASTTGTKRSRRHSLLVGGSETRPELGRTVPPAI